MTQGGYRGKSLELLLRFKVTIGDYVSLETTQGSYTATIIPRHEYAEPDRIVVKLENGYNTGVFVNKIKSIKKIKRVNYADNIPQNGGLTSKIDEIFSMKSEGEKSPNLEADVPALEGLPLLSLISTGGTISSKIDYRTGGVRAALSALDLYSSVPELQKYASIEPQVLFSKYSENVTPNDWTEIAKTIDQKIRSGKYRGIIIAHGTDTMHYTAAALSFALKNLPIPVVLVGAQRSSDRPSSDSALNLLGAAIMAIKSEVAGVFVAMHNSISDNCVACHIGTRVRKNHTSRRDAFESIDTEPVALIREGKIEYVESKSKIFLAKRTKEFEKMLVRPDFDRNVALLKFYPGFDPRLIDFSVKRGNKIIILEGTGLGHVSNECVPPLKNAIKHHVLVFMVSQCIWGRTSLDVYETGRDLLSIGVIPLGNMLSETAIVKAMWALGSLKSLDEIKDVMPLNLANEITNKLTFG